MTAATPPPRSTHMQQTTFPRLIYGIDDRNPRNIPPVSAGWVKSSSGGGPPGRGGRAGSSGGASTGFPHCRQKRASSGNSAPQFLQEITDLLNPLFHKRRGRQSHQNSGEGTKPCGVDEHTGDHEFRKH